MADEVTILGAGLVGICTALSLAERGVCVRIIDRGPPGQETSAGNAGVISPWSIIPQSLPGTWRQIPQLMFGAQRPLSIKAATWPKMIPWGLQFLRNGSEAKVRETADLMELLCGPSIVLYQRHLSGTGAEDLIQNSLYIHAFRDASRANLDSLDYAIRSEKGADVALVGRDELARLEPALSSEFKAAVVIHGQARALSPGRIGSELAKKAHQMGVTFVRDSIHSLKREADGWKVVCATQTFDCPTIVLSMGAWSADVLLMAERGYHVEFASPGIEIRNSVMDVDAKVVASSMERGVRVAGQAEFAPVDAPPDPAKEALLQRLARSAFPDLKATATRFWMGRRPSFPDSLPVLGAVPDRPGLYVNFGHSHYGLMMAPKSGEITADLIVGRSQNHELSKLQIDRFL